MGSCISGGGVKHILWYFGKEGEADTNLKCFTFDLFTFSINIS